MYPSTTDTHPRTSTHLRRVREFLGIFQNFAEYASIYPEFKHVFVGDNGQGDVRAAEMMAEKFPHLLEAIYMHRVRPRRVEHVSALRSNEIEGRRAVFT